MNKQIEILLVEDNPGDVVLIQRAFKHHPFKNPVHWHVACDGVEALQLLRRKEGPRPDLILLDLNLPKITGLEILAKIKSDADLQRIPVIVLTSSNAPDDIAESYMLQAICYIQKPSTYRKFDDVVKQIEEVWLSYLLK